MSFVEHWEHKMIPRDISSKEFVEDELYRRFLSVKHYCDFEWLDKENVHYREHDTVNE